MFVLQLQGSVVGQSQVSLTELKNTLRLADVNYILVANQPQFFFYYYSYDNLIKNGDSKTKMVAFFLLLRSLH